MRIIFIGTGEIGLPTLRFLLETKEHELVGIVTQPDKPAGRELKIKISPIKAALGDRPLPVLQPLRIKTPEAIASLAALQPDVIVVMAYGQILPRAVLDLPRVACLNLHASLLPRHRGAAPIQAAILAGDRATGITVMYMAEGLDTGDVLLESKIDLAARETGGSLHDRLAEIAPAALNEALVRLSDRTAPRLPQNEAEATHAPKLARDHGKIDWSESAELIERKIRAYDPWPGAFTLVRDPGGRERKLKIFRAKLTDTGALALEEAQLEGKRRMSLGDLLRGHPWIAKSLGAKLLSS